MIRSTLKRYNSIKKQELVLKNFVRSNLSLLNLNFIFFFSVWIYSTIAPLILQKDFGMSSVELTYYQNIYILATVFTFALSNIIMGKKVSYIKMIKWPLISLPVVSLVMYLTLHFGWNMSLLYVSRFVEGLACGYFLSIVSFVLKTKLLSEERNGEINSYLISVGYFLKVVVPIITINVFVLNHDPENIFLLSFIVYMILLVHYLKVARTISFKYNRDILKHKITTCEIVHDTIGSSLKNHMSFFVKKENWFVKLYFIYTISLRYAMRPFFDLYLGLYLIMEYKISIEHITLLISLMVAGQALQALTGRLSDKVNLSTFNIIQLILQTMLLYIIIETDIVKDYYYLSLLIFFILGMARSMYANYDYKITNYVIKKGSFPVNEITFIHNTFGELIHYFTYVVAGVLLVFIDLQTLAQYPLIISGLLILGWGIFDRVLFKRTVKN